MRKRFEAVEGGLQAAAVILPNQFAAKINEEDGYGPHMNSKVNLIKYMNGETIFYLTVKLNFQLYIEMNLDS